MKKIISTNNAPAAIGPYSQAIEVNGIVFLSDNFLSIRQRVIFPEGGAKEQNRTMFQNIKAILAEAGLTTDNIVKTTVLLNDIAHFGAMNEVYATQFSEPSRTFGFCCQRPAKRSILVR